ncbi:MAG: MFS transporter [Desulfurococcaceae archaeon]
MFKNYVSIAKISLNEVSSSLKQLFSLLKGNVGIMVLSWFLYGVAGGLSGNYFSLYFKDLGGTDLMLASARSTALLVGSIMIFIGGFLTDIIGRVKTILIGTALVTINTFIYAIARNANELAVLMILDNAFHFYQPALTAIIMDSLPRDRALMGFFATQIFPSIPGLFAPLIGGILYDKVGVNGIRIGYVIAGIISSYVLYLRIRFLRETLLKNTNRDLEHIFIEVFHYRYHFINAMKIYVYTGFLGPLITAVSSVYGMIYAYEILGVSKTFLGLLSTLGTSISIISSLALAGRIRNVRKVLPISLSMVSLSQVLYALPYYVGYRNIFLIASTIVGSAAGVAIGPVIQTIIMNTLPREVRGRGIGFQRVFENASASIVTMVAGLLYIKLGGPRSLLLSPLFATVAISYLLFITQVSSSVEDLNSKH